MLELLIAILSVFGVASIDNQPRRQAPVVRSQSTAVSEPADMGVAIASGGAILLIAQKCKKKSSD